MKRFNLVFNRRSVANLFVTSCTLAAAALCCNLAEARLGTFSAADGYQHLITPPGANYNWSDVTYYNAGTYGANAGGGSGPTFIAPDSGSWKLVSQVGGFFASSTDRTTGVSGSPPYPLTIPSNTVASYMVGAHFPGHNNDGHNLAFRNDTPAGTGPAIYEYSLDQYDMGAAPSSITSGVVDTQFYFLPTVAVPNNTGAAPVDKFTLSFVDTSGNVGLQWGYAKDNEVTWRTSSSNPWNYTGIYAADQSSNQWDSVKLAIDLTADTFQLDYFDLSANLWLNLAPAGTPLGQAMQDLTVLRWRLEDDNSSFFAGKNYFDDFSFNVVPEPSSIVMATLAGCAVCVVGARRRRK
jgi:hypothetical protein